mmetsp:Transcript_52729/g.140682  ORF Transcript_52729/g.140682 Transcript_52729/m.140682 type:complete len:299 (-) Transcript_52729:1827-2723(-)
MGRTIMGTFSRRQARVFSLIPPTRSTFPVNVSSPVIARSLRTGWFKAMLNKDVVIVTPADGPSFGVAPSGKLTCIDASSRKAFGGSTSRMKIRAKVSAISLDSSITFPSLPVIFKRAPDPARPFPSAFSRGTLPRASTNRVLPPSAVQAKPLTTPGGIPSANIVSAAKGGCPTYLTRFSAAMTVRFRFSSLSLTMLRAVFLTIFSSNFLSSLTPASLAYSMISFWTASCPRSRSSRVIPQLSIALGMRYWLAISSFSSAMYPAMWITSILSRRGSGIVLVTFAVQTKSTRERSTGTSR